METTVYILGLPFPKTEKTTTSDDKGLCILSYSMFCAHVIQTTCLPIYLLTTTTSSWWRSGSKRPEPTSWLNTVGLRTILPTNKV